MTLRIAAKMIIFSIIVFYNNRRGAQPGTAAIRERCAVGKISDAEPVQRFAYFGYVCCQAQKWMIAADDHKWPFLVVAGILRLTSTLGNKQKIVINFIKIICIFNNLMRVAINI